jgi:alanine racemase
MMARAIWAEIDLDRLAHNMEEVTRLVNGEALITAVIKADGYGHGAQVIGRTLIDHGADRFAVATYSEAVSLRKHYATIPIMVLGYTREEDFESAQNNGIILTIYDYLQAEIISKYHPGIKVHLKINTGMNRLGFRTDSDELLKTLQLLTLDIEGIYTHFALADEKDKTFTHLQVERFEQALEIAQHLGRDIQIKHVSNSAAIIDLPEYRYDMVRAGIMLYGLYPSEDIDKTAVDLKQVMSLKAQVAMVNQLSPGEGVSYGQLYTVDIGRKIAALPFGYADGFSRMLTGKAQVAFNGEIRPIVGRICMDQCMMDAEGLDIHRDDVVEIYGETITIDEVAKHLGTINYEIVCMVGKRVPRKYLQGGKEVAYMDYITANL